MSSLAVTARNLSKRYRVPGLREFWALRDVSFEVQCGEIIGILGANGAGKSTLLKILSRVVSPCDGWVEVRGRLGSLLQVGAGFHHELSGKENIFLNGAILGMSKADIQQRFADIVEFAEIGNFLHVPLKHYSSGMAARLAFSIAVHLEPEVLIVDEALSVGDASFQAKSQSKMREVIREGRTVLLVSHNLTILPDLCTRAFLLSHGRLVKEGPLDIIQDFYTRHSGEDDSKSEPIKILGEPQPEPLTFKRLILKEFTYDDEAVEVVANFEIQRRVAVRARILVIAKAGEPVLVSAGEFATLAPGNYELHCEIPPDLLWPLAYVLEWSMESSSGKVWSLRQSFLVRSRSPHTKGFPHAWVRVPLRWSDPVALEGVSQVPVNVAKAPQP